MSEVIVCPLCKRSNVKMSDHHLIPKSRGGRWTETICDACHRQIHALYDNKTLENELSTVEALLAEPQFHTFLTWIRKQPADRKFRIRQARSIRKKRRR